MTYEKLNDTLDKKMLDFNLKILALLASLIIKPLSLATEPFFRKNFGERYFSGTGFFISIILWNLAQSVSNSVSHSPFVEILRDAHCTTLATWAHEYHFSSRVAWLISFIYGFIGMRQYIIVRSRQRKGKEWHSMSRGESIFGRESRVRDILMLFLGGGLLTIIAPAVGLLFVASQYASIFLAIKMEKSFYNRYLDIIDAKLENEFMQQCLDSGEPPADLNGLFYPLPKAIQGENRVRVARVVAATQFATNAPIADQPWAQARPTATAQQTVFTQQQTAPPKQETVATPQPSPDPMAEFRSRAAAMKPGFEDATKFASKAAASAVGFLASKQFMRATVGVLLLLVIAIVAVFGVELIKSHWQSAPKPPTIQTAPKPATQPAAVKPTAPPISVADPVSVAPQVAATPPVVTPAVETRQAATEQPAMAIPKVQETPSNNSAVAAVQQDASNATPPNPVIVTPQQTDDLKPKNPVIVAPQEKSIVPVTATPDMAAAVEALNTFSNYCVTTLAAENDQIQKISNNGLRNKMSMSLLQVQTGVGNVIGRQRALLEGITPGTESMVFRTLSVTRETMTNALTRFSAEIYNATLRR